MHSGTTSAIFPSSAENEQQIVSTMKLFALLIAVGLSFGLVLLLLCFLVVRRLRRERTAKVVESRVAVPLRKLPTLISTLDETLDSTPMHSETPSTDSEVESASTVESVLPAFENSLLDFFRLELLYKCSLAATDDDHLHFQIVRLTPTQTLIDDSFPSLFCRLRLFSGDDRRPARKFSSKKNPIDESFRLKIDRTNFEKSYLKVQILGQHQQHEKLLELGQTVLVLHQIATNGEIQKKFIQIYEDRIGLINRFQTMTRNATRALICLVYENERCLVQIGVIKILGLEYLLQQTIEHVHRHDEIQLKLSTSVDGRVLIKRKSKRFSTRKNLFTFNTSFSIDYLSLEKVLLRLVLCYRRPLLGASPKPISILEFSSRQISNGQTFHHWSETLAEPNRPHVQWHNFEPIDGEKKEKRFYSKPK